MNRAAAAAAVKAALVDASETRTMELSTHVRPPPSLRPGPVLHDESGCCE
jgi:hypothetical protein